MRIADARRTICDPKSEIQALAAARAVIFAQMVDDSKNCQRPAPAGRLL